MNSDKRVWARMKDVVIVESRLDTIDFLIDRLQQAVESERNRTVAARPLKVFYGAEEPICWTIIFGYDANHYLNDPTFYFEQTLRQMLWRWETFPDDQWPLTLELPAWLSHYPEFSLLGLDVSFSSRGVPHFSADHPISKDPDLRHLKPVDFYTSGWMPRVLRWYEELTRIAAGRIKVVFRMEWWRGCLDLAIHLRGYENFIRDCWERPRFVHDLLGFITEQRCRWHEAYWKHFGLKKQPANIGDDWVNIPFITPDIFVEFVLPRYLEMEAYHGGFRHVHSCGNQTPVQQYLLQIKSLKEFEIGPWSDFDQSLANIPPNKLLCISLHPNDVLCAEVGAMETQLDYIRERCRGRDYVVLTSGLTPLHDDVEDYIRRIRAWTGAARRILIGDGAPAPMLETAESTV